MKFSLPKSFSAILLVAGLAILTLVVVAKDLPTAYGAFLNGVGGLLMSLGGFYLSAKQENDKHAEEIKKLQEAHVAERALIERKVTTRGEEYLIRQYAQDTIRIAMNRSLLDKIAFHARAQTPNIPAIESLLDVCRDSDLMGFYEKANDLLSRDDGIEVLMKFVIHVDQVINSSTNIPDAVRLKNEELKKLLAMATSAGQAAAKNKVASQPN